MPPKHRHIISCHIFWVGFLILILPQKTYSQQVIQQLVNSHSIGYDVSQITGSLSLGESAISTIEGPGGIITQGFLQPKLHKPCDSFLLDYYPNPVIHKITILDNTCGRLISSIVIYDSYGRWMESYALDNRQADLSDLMPGVYLLRAFGSEEDFLGAFKIIKILSDG